MDIETLAKLGLLLAVLCYVLVMRMRRSRTGQGFSAQVGDVVLVGEYLVKDGAVRVTCDRGTAVEPLKNRRPIHVAEQLLARLHGVG